MCLGNRFIDKFWLLCVIWHGTLYSVFLCNFQFYNFSQTSSNSDSLFNFYNNSNNFEKIIFIYAGMKVFMRVSTSVYIPRYVCTYEDTYVSMYHGVLHGVSPPLFYPLPIQRSPSWWETSCVPPPLFTFSGTEVPVPWFTDIICKTIQKFRFIKICLTRYNVIILHLKTFSNIL